MTWLITGGSGYIGRHIVNEFQSAKISVVVYDTHGHESQKSLREGFSLVLGDIRDAVNLRRTLQNSKFEGILNLSALKSVSESLVKPSLYEEINFHSAAKLMELSVEFGIPYFIQSSSAAVYGNENEGVVSENMSTNPISPYGSSKLMAEEHLTSLILSKKLKGASLRYFNVAGASDVSLKDTGTSNVFPIFARQLKSRKSPIIYGHGLGTIDGTCVRDYIHVADLARAHSQLLENLKTRVISPVINLGSGVGTSVLDIHKEISQFLRVDVEPIFMSKREGDPVSLIADTQIAEKDLKFKASKSLADIVASCF
jgi:UDP-glucose 4-epimerase